MSAGNSSVLLMIFLVFHVSVVMFAYEQCLLCLGHHPDVWIEAASYLEQSSRLLAEKGVRIKRAFDSMETKEFSHVML